MVADDKARQHIVALAQKLHEFGHQTEERELDLWHRLSYAMDLPRVERLWARNQGTWETEYNNFIKELLAFVNKELDEFWCSIVSMGDSIRNFCIYNTQG